MSELKLTFDTEYASIRRNMCRMVNNLSKA